MTATTTNVNTPMKRPGQGDHATMDDVRKDLRAVRTEVSGAVSDIADAGTELARDAAKRISTSARNACSATERVIAERPLTSVLIALGVGAVIAKVLSRRH